MKQKSDWTLRHIAPVGVALLVAVVGSAVPVAAASPAATAPVAAKATGTPRYVSPYGTDTGTCTTKAAPCQTVQYAVGQATVGDTINLARGAYVEQVSIAKSLTIVGAGPDESTIEAPSALVLNSQNVNAIVDVTGGSTTVSITGLTVAGPGPQGGGNNCAPNPTSLDKGIDVHAGATLNMWAAAVRNVYDRPTSGCQRGDAISIGTPCFSCTPAEVGHATLRNVVVSVYQKNGVAVRGPGSTLGISTSLVANNPSPVIASNGIEVLSGAVATIWGNTVTGNECNLTPACGPDPFSTTEAEADGILVAGAGASTSIKGNRVFGNDMGIYTDDGVTVSQNNAGNNRDVGIFVDAHASHGQIIGNTASKGGTGSGLYGIITVSGLGNRFAGDSAKGNATFDLDAVITGADSNTYSANHCGTASPSRGYWHCH